MEQFSQDKQDMLPVLTKLFASPNQDTLRIQGPPGCGKTTVIEMIVRHFLQLNELQTTIDPETQKMSSANVFLSATTNKATSVIFEEVCTELEKDYGAISCTTIYSLLGLKVFNDFNTGKTKVQRNRHSSLRHFPDNSLVIIDEASYTDWVLWNHIEEQLLGMNLNVIFIADFYQATPVNCRVSPIFNPEIPVYSLTERFRYPVNSAIHQNSLLCEKAIDTGVVDKLMFDSTCERIRRTDLAPLLKQHMVDNDYNSRVLAYRNQTVVAYNNEICKQRYGDTGFHVGQRVVSNRFYKFGDYIIQNERNLTITKIGEPYVGLEGIHLRDLQFRGFGNLQVPIPIDYAQFQAVLRRLKSEANWPLFYQVQESIADMRHTWASTVHKAQGSTFDFCILDFNDLLGVKNMLLFYRLLNVAITRPRQKVFICKD